MKRHVANLRHVAFLSASVLRQLALAVMLEVRYPRNAPFGINVAIF